VEVYGASSGGEGLRMMPEMDGPSDLTQRHGGTEINSSLCLRVSV
jgi:hypothetical protein